MFIQYITFRDFGGVSGFAASLTPGINIIESRDIPVLTAAISLLLCNRVQLPPGWVQASTRLEATVMIKGEGYHLSVGIRDGKPVLTATDETGADVTEAYQDTLYHCLEQDAAEFFDGQDKTAPNRLFRYHNHREYYAGLSCRTDRITDTKTFRGHLLRFIKTFQPEPLHNKLHHLITVDPQGKFSVIHPGLPGSIHLSETEEKLFFYTCFLNAAAFWEDTEKARDLHHEKKPLLVVNFLEYLDETADLSGLIGRTHQLQRQVILFTHFLSDPLKKSMALYREAKRMFL